MLADQVEEIFNDGNADLERALSTEMAEGMKRIEWILGDECYADLESSTGTQYCLSHHRESRALHIQRTDGTSKEINGPGLRVLADYLSERFVYTNSGWIDKQAPNS